MSSLDTRDAALKTASKYLFTQPVNSASSAVLALPDLCLKTFTQSQKGGNIEVFIFHGT